MPDVGGMEFLIAVANAALVDAQAAIVPDDMTLRIAAKWHSEGRSCCARRLQLAELQLY